MVELLSHNIRTVMVTGFVVSLLKSLQWDNPICMSLLLANLFSDANEEDEFEITIRITSNFSDEFVLVTINILFYFIIHLHRYDSKFRSYRLL